MQDRPLPETVNTLKNLMRGCLLYPEFSLTFAWAAWELLAWDRVIHIKLESYAWRENLRWQVIQCYKRHLLMQSRQSLNSVLVRFLFLLTVNRITSTPQYRQQRKRRRVTSAARLAQLVRAFG